MKRNGSQTVQNQVLLIAAILIVVIGFSWRLVYWRRISLFIDEFTTILAAQMIVQQGAPQMPSGLFYDNGILFSYIVAAFIGATGFSEVIARFPSICFSLLSVAITLRLGRRFFSPGVALLATTLLTLAPEAVIWGARSRAYASFQFWTMVGIWALAEGITSQWRGRWRALFWTAMSAAALSHLGGVVFTLCSLVAALPARYLWARGEQQGGVDLRRQILSLWPDGLLTVTMLAGMAALVLAGQPAWAGATTGPVIATGDTPSSALPQTNWLGVMGLMAPMLLRPQLLPWMILVLVNLVILLHRAITTRLHRTDAIPLFLNGVWLSSVIVLTVGSPWHAPRYILPLMPIFFLLSSYEMANAIRRLPALSSQKWKLKRRPWLAGIIVFSAIVLLWHPLYRVVTRQEDGYDLAFRYVQTHWHEGDAVMTFNTSGSYVYLGQCDYYPIHIDAWLLNTPAGPVDRYTGAQWIASVAQLDAALARSPRTWYVIDELRSRVRVYPEVQESIKTRFRSVFRGRSVEVFLHDRSW